MALNIVYMGIRYEIISNSQIYHGKVAGTSRVESDTSAWLYLNDDAIVLPAFKTSNIQHSDKTFHRENQPVFKI